MAYLKVLSCNLRTGTDEKYNTKLIRMAEIDLSVLSNLRARFFDSLFVISFFDCYCVCVITYFLIDKLSTSITLNKYISSPS